MKVSVILPAAGTGERMLCSKPKQYIEVHGSPILVHTLRAFLSIPCVDFIVIVVSDEYTSFVENDLFCQLDICNRKKVAVVTGAESRHKSIVAGLNHFDDNEKPDFIVVHDCVRPFVDSELLLQLIEAANDCGASGPVCNLTSTVLQTSQGFVDCALQRSKYRNSETPQVFKYNVIREAYDKCSENDLIFGTECLDLVKKYTNCKVRVIEANANLLFKVTHKRDLYAVEGILRESQSVGLLSIRCENESHEIFKRDVFENLKSKFSDVFEVKDLSFMVEKNVHILLVLHFGDSEHVFDILNKLKHYKNLKIVFVLVKHANCNHHASDKLNQFCSAINNIVFVNFQWSVRKTGLKEPKQ